MTKSIFNCFSFSPLRSEWRVSQAAPRLHCSAPLRPTPLRSAPFCSVLVLYILTISPLIPSHEPMSIGSFCRYSCTCRM